MNTSPPRFRFRQRGIVSIVAAILLIAAVIFVLGQTFGIIGNTSNANTSQGDSVAAFFLAESGVERAQAAINSAALAGTYTNTTCTGLAGISSSLGRGDYIYDSATSFPSLCGGGSPSCETCTVFVKGRVGASSRTLRFVASSTQADGASGCGSNFTLDLPIPATLGSPSVFTNIAWRAKGVSGVCEGGSKSNANVSSCQISGGGSCFLGSKSWLVTGTGTGNVNSVGVYGKPPSLPGIYSLSFALSAPPGATPTIRSYSATGVVLFPLNATGEVDFIGSYGLDHETESTSDLDGIVPARWTCSLNNGSDNDMSRAAGSDTLLYGLSALGGAAGNEASRLVFGIQPMFRIVSLPTTNTDFLYSQTWVSYNPRYWQQTAGATNGANFTGTIGSSFNGTVNPSDTLNLDSVASLAVGSRIIDPVTSKQYGTVLSLKPGTGTWGDSGSKYNITGNTNGNFTPSSTLRAYDVLTLTTAASSGKLTLGDAITNSGGSTTYGTLGALSPSGTTWGAVGSTYALPSTAYFTTAASLESVGTTITVPAGGTAPTVGTAFAVTSGTGAFGSNSFTGRIDGVTLTVESGSPPALGDALYGRYVQPGTRVTAGSGSIFTVTRPFTSPQTADQTAPSGTILARAAVRGLDSGAPADPGVTSFVVSRKPTPRLSSNAQLCGGICPFLYPFTGSGPSTKTEFTITGLTSGRDWSSGFACLNNVSPNNIRHLSRIVSKIGSWSEPPQ